MSTTTTITTTTTDTDTSTRAGDRMLDMGALGKHPSTQVYIVLSATALVLVGLAFVFWRRNRRPSSSPSKEHSSHREHSEHVPSAVLVHSSRGAATAKASKNHTGDQEQPKNMLSVVVVTSPRSLTPVSGTTTNTITNNNNDLHSAELHQRKSPTSSSREEGELDLGDALKQERKPGELVPLPSASTSPETAPKRAQKERRVSRVIAQRLRENERKLNG